MTRAVFAPGLDRVSGTGRPNASYRPGNGAGGQFAHVLQGATPKYAINRGPRADQYRNTMARMFIRVEAREMNLFLSSIGDSHTQRQLAPRLAGDPAPQQSNRRSGGGSANDVINARSRTVAANGYLDFLIQQVQMPLQEKVQVAETLSDNYVAYTFGQAPPTWTFSGALLNTVQDDQASNFFRLYTEILRASQLAKRQKTISLSFDSYVVNGIMTMQAQAISVTNELYIPFSFQLLVKRVFIVNYTSGWVPTRAETPFAADLNAIAYDGRPREEGALTRIAARIPNDTEEVTPTPQRQQNAAVSLANPQDVGAVEPNYSVSPTSSAPPANASVAPRRSEAMSVYSPRPETVNASGVQSLQSVSPSTPASRGPT